MRQLSRVISICFIALLMSRNCCKATLLSDTTTIINKSDTVMIFETLVDAFPVRTFLMKTSDNLWQNDSILNCSVCGGKISETLDTVYFKKDILYVVQSTDDFTDTITFGKKRGNYYLLSFSRYSYAARRSTKIQPKNKKLRSFNYYRFLSYR